MSANKMFKYTDASTSSFTMNESQTTPVLPKNFRFGSTDKKPMFDPASVLFPMACTINLPDETLNILKCSNCKQHLSIFPIHSDNNGSQVCGRCPQNSPDAIQQYAYEAVAAFVRFPCKNTEYGCSVTLTPENMKNHENYCEYQQYNCFENCGWKGSLPNVKDHYKRMHEDSVVNVEEDFAVSSLRERKVIQVVVVDEEGSFLVRLKQENVELFAEVYLIHGISLYCNYKFEINFKLLADISVKLQERNVNRISEYTREDVKKIAMDGIDLNKVNLCRFKILNTAKMNNDPLNELIVQPSFHHHFICTVCNAYIKPALIFECPSGHLMCGSHDKFLGEKCNKCFKIIHRSLTLEKLVTSITFPCTNAGCNKTFLINEDHNKICEYRRLNCPYNNCSITGTVNIILSHLKVSHSTKLDSPQKLSKRNIVDVIVQNNNIFQVIMKFEQNMLQISVKNYAPTHKDLRVVSELIMENSNNNERIYIKSSEAIYLLESMLTKNGTCMLTDWSYKITIHGMCY